jgi:hypothetical protein
LIEFLTYSGIQTPLPRPTPLDEIEAAAALEHAMALVEGTGSCPRPERADQ